jgi:hypothetical protein
MQEPMQDAITQIHARKRPRPGRRIGLGFCLLLLGGALVGRPAGQEPAPQHPFSRQQSPFDDSVERDPVFVARQLKARNIERQKSIVNDTEKLLKLARELKTETDTGNQNELTQGELHKLAEIEKLARNVKQKMSISFVGGPLPPGYRNAMDSLRRFP